MLKVIEKLISINFKLVILITEVERQCPNKAYDLPEKPGRSKPYPLLLIQSPNFVRSLLSFTQEEQHEKTRLKSYELFGKANS